MTNKNYDMKYPRYFVVTDQYRNEVNKKNNRVWLHYAVVRTRGGRIKYKHVNGLWDYTHKSNESNADNNVKLGFWKEIPAAEFVLINGFL